MSELKIVLPERAENSFDDFRSDFGAFGNIATGILGDSAFSKLQKEFDLSLAVYEDYLLQDLMNFSMAAADLRSGWQGEEFEWNTARRDGLHRLGFQAASAVFDDYLTLLQRVADDATQFPSLDEAALGDLQPALTQLDERLVEIAKSLPRDEFAAAAARAYDVEFRSLHQTVAYWLGLVRESEFHREMMANAKAAPTLEFTNCTSEQIATLHNNDIAWSFPLFEFTQSREENIVLMLWETNKGAIGLPFFPNQAVGFVVSIWPDETPLLRL